MVGGDGVEEARGGESGRVSCAASGGALHGLEPAGAFVHVWIPANGSATVTARFAVAPTAFWPTTDHRPLFRLAGYASSASQRVARPDGAPVAERAMLPPPLRPVGPRGVRIVLETEPPSAPYARLPAPGVPAGVALRLRGTTDPPLPGGTITLRRRGPSTGDRLADVAAVALDARGTFSYRGWRPGDTGFNEVWAFAVPDPGSGLVPDHFCPRGLVIEGSGAETASYETLLAGAFVARTRSRRWIEVTIACSGPVGGRCDGRVSLRARRTRGSAPFAVASGATRAVRVRVARRGVLPRRIAVTAAAGTAVTRARLALRGPRRAPR